MYFTALLYKIIHIYYGKQFSGIIQLTDILTNNKKKRLRDHGYYTHSVYYTRYILYH